MGYRIGHKTDLLVRGTASAPAVRFAFTEVRQTVSAGIAAHDTDPLAASVFGRALTVAALMGALLKNNEKFTLRWEYKGAIGSILADVNTRGHIRGIPRNPHLMSEGPMKSQDLFGDDGTITVIRSREGRILNSGSTRAALLDIADDMGFFLSTSDQVESELVTLLDFNPSPKDPVSSAAGFLVQAMPGCDFEQFDGVRKALRGEPFRELLADSTLAWEPKLHGLLGILMAPVHPSGSLLTAAGLHYEFGRAPSYTCSCTPERMKGALAMLEREELEAMVRENETAEVLCEFCGRRHTFDPREIRPAAE